MTFINETFELTLNNDKKVKIIHKGYKPMKIQETGLDELKECIEECIINEKITGGFIPYSNFECSVDWKII
jgi:hypothetical protein